jgi:hypothetical protein
METASKDGHICVAVALPNRVGAFRHNLSENHPARQCRYKKSVVPTFIIGTTHWSILLA